MMKISHLSLLGAVCASLVLSPRLQRADAAPGVPFTSKKDGYSIVLPGKLKAASRQMAAPGMGNVKVNFVTASAPPLVYVVIPMTLPGKPTGANIEQFLSGVQRGFTASTAAKLVSSKPLTLSGAPGREVVIQVGKNLMRGRFFVKGSRSYQVIAISPLAGQAKYGPQITQVLNSFKLLP